MNNKQKGFTLIEVLIVISIIGVLSSLTLLGLGTFRASGRDVRRVTDLRQITNALELYYAKNGSYPVTVGWEDALAKTAATKVIDKVPKDPNGASYVYGACGTTGTTGYAIQATLEEANKKILDESAPASSCGVPCVVADKQYCIKF